MKGGGAIVMHAAARKQVPKSKTSFFLYILLLYVLLPVLVLYVVALAVSPFYSRPCPQDGGAGDVARLAAAADGKWHNNSSSSSTSVTQLPPPKARPKPKASADDDAAPTRLRHIVFGIGASSSLWKSRREYIRVWWRPGEMRGFVWLDKPVPELYSRNASSGLPGIKISGNTSRFPYTHGAGSRSALRITRIVSMSFRLGLPGARWFVMGDDDTVFFPDNLADVLSQYDHTQPYYIGNPSESHIQNLIFSYGMAFGGGGFAISRALAAQLARMQDGCIELYPALYGSDDRIHACMSELGVPLTRHLGFHQCDLWGDVLGLLGAHPVAPLVSRHHFDFLQPVFPTVRSRTQALRRLFAGPVALDPAAVAQQSVCYDAGKEWTVSVSWGFAVVVLRGVLSPRETETPMRAFLNWYPPRRLHGVGVQHASRGAAPMPEAAGVLHAAGAAGTPPAQPQHHHGDRVREARGAARAVPVAHPGPRRAAGPRRRAQEARPRALETGPEEELLQGGVVADGGEGPEDDHRRRRLQRRRVRQGLGSLRRGSRR
ncbi:uncharacterized protein [Miscanthus floridulus]|uniref:uncharacterized protein isoform X2 n=1 Tax=Miscanthus floridulus TaxID=154761 RepID=UPI003459F5DC